LGIVGHRPVAVHCDGHRTHAEEAERDQAEREHGGHDGGLGRHRVDDGGQVVLRHEVGARHQAHDHYAHPEGGEVASGHNFADVARTDRVDILPSLKGGDS